MDSIIITLSILMLGGLVSGQLSHHPVYLNALDRVIIPLSELRGLVFGQGDKLPCLS